jgi:hypothetical protein
MPQPHNEIDVLRDISQRFERAEVAYMLTGSMAMNYYAQPRMTRDFDFVIELAADKAGKLISTLGEDYYVSRDAIDGAILAPSMFNVIHQETLIKIDCIIRKPAPYRVVEFSRRNRVRLEDFAIWIVSKEDLILSKLEWAKDSHSEFQLRDVRSLLATGYDSNYLLHWTDALGLGTLLRECLNE